MRNFEEEKNQLIKSLIAKGNLDDSQQILKKWLESLNHHSELDTDQSKEIINRLDIPKEIELRIQDFIHHFRDKTNLIISIPLRKIAKDLQNQGVAITSFGQAWSKQSANWIYFDTVLNISELKAQYQQNEAITAHENTDPRSGLERGLIDTKTGEGLMGKLN